MHNFKFLIGFFLFVGWVIAVPLRAHAEEARPALAHGQVAGKVFDKLSGETIIGAM